MTAPRVALFGYSDVGHACLSLLLERGVNVVAAYTHRDDPSERLWFPSLAALARDHRIAVREDADFREATEVSRLADLRPDLLLSCYYRRILPPPVLSIPPLGAFNLHGSLLPRYRGRAPVNWAVLNGEAATGATLHVMTDRADAGDIVDQEAVPIGPDDTAGEVQGRVTRAALLVLERQLPALLAGRAPRRPQDESLATRFGRRRPEDGAFAWTWTAAAIHDLVRAVSHPYPGAFTPLGADRLTLWRTRRIGRVGSAAPGAIVVREDRACVACGDGEWLELLDAQVNDEAPLRGAILAERLARRPAPTA